jgi:4-hydroxybenzoate polyprenyltransferase
MAADTLAATQSSRVGRLALYSAQMFPLPAMLTMAAGHFFALWFGLQALGALSPVRATATAARGVASVFLFLLLMRLYDELKDAATDIALGRAGDPLYRDRVLVTGAVTLGDVRWLRWAVTILLVALNLRPQLTWATWTFWLAFVFMWLSFHWFFWPAVSRHLLLAFVTHNPLTLLLDGYVVGLFLDQFVASPPRGWVALLFGLWLPLAAWETSRKVRAPQDETAYSTYSKVLGWRVAGLLPGVFAVGSAAFLIGASRSAGLGPAFPIVVAAAAGLVLARGIQFLLAPSTERAQLKPWATAFVLVANAGLAIAVPIERGFTW